MQKRVAFWDNYKGILICLVVFGHFIYSSALHVPKSFLNDIFTFIYLFHMPAFVFCSGYFSKSEKAAEKPAILRLLLYYLVFNSLMMVYCYFDKGTFFHLLTPYNTYWYLLCLIFWRLIIRHVAHIKWMIPFSVAASLLVGFWPEFSNVLALDRTVAFFVFFLLGYLFEEKWLNALRARRTVLKTVLFWGAALIAAVGLFLFIRTRYIDVVVLTMGAYRSGREIFYRLFILGVSAVAIVAMLMVVPTVRVPILTKVGKNSLTIYVLHRFFTLMFDRLFPAADYTKWYVVYAFAAAVFTVLLLGSDKLNAWISGTFRKAAEMILDGQSRMGRTLVCGILVIAVLVSSVPFVQRSVRKLQTAEKDVEIAVDELVENNIVISFVGDLILLKKQVMSAYNAQTGEYDFSDVFRYAAPYLSEADYTIGVFEGPTAGADRGYSTSNFGDGYAFYLNFPDSFAEAVKEAGIDLVTLSNNHLMDMGLDGAMRTLDVLDEVGLAHVGAYRNQEEKDQLTIVDVDGVQIAVLSYTQFVNYYEVDQLEEELPYLTSLLPEQDDVYYDRLKQQIADDFAQAKAADVDLIFVLPHMGTQFMHETDEFQDEWNRFFASMGADVILGDHVHAVQPIEQIGETLVVNCPGNFANSYVNYNGDATAITEIHIDRDTKQVTAASVIPMYTQEMKSGYFRALPIYDVLTTTELHEQMAAVELLRIEEVHGLITKVMLGEKLTTGSVQPRYFWANGKYCENKFSLIESYDAYKHTDFYQMLDDSEKIVFIGDSITQGSRNGRHPWYEPLTDYFTGKQIVNISKSSYTTSMITQEFGEEIQGAGGDLYVIAIGTNDIRYQDPTICALNEDEYLEDIRMMIEQIQKGSPNAKIALISPWVTLECDKSSELPHSEKISAMQDYCNALEAFAVENEYAFSCPNSYLLSFYEEHPYLQYTKDGIHPNAEKGVDLYSKAVLEGALAHQK